LSPSEWRLVAATLFAKAVLDDAPLALALGMQSAVAALLFAPLAAWEGSLLPAYDTHFVASVIWFILFSTIGAYGLYWICLRRATATRVSSLIYLTPPVTILWAWLMFGDAILPSTLFGFAICMMGVLLTRNRSDDVPE